VDEPDLFVYTRELRRASAPVSMPDIGEREGSETMPALKRVTRFDQLDIWFGGPQDEYISRYEQALQSLGGGDNLSDLASVRVDAHLADHFSAHWLTDWWPDLQPIDGILRAGLQEAITTALDARLPLTGLWVQTGESTFETFVDKSRNQITFVVLTPAAPET